MIKQLISTTQSRLEHTLHNLLPEPSTTDTRLLEACRYSLLNGGKRLRPLLVHLTGQLFNGNQNDLDKLAAAIECIHCYSLVHDDLPAMDDDELRRGKPTCHIEFDEASAILAGDALQTLAFEIASNDHFESVSAANQIRIISEMAQASGLRGMCGGQALDLAATDKCIALSELETVHRLKTGALLKAAIRIGAIAANASNDELKHLSDYADAIGLAFQVQDDILDIESTTEILGKPQGSDQHANKSTYPAHLGLEEAKLKATQLVQDAITALERIDADTGRLKAVAEYIIERDH